MFKNAIVRVNPKSLITAFLMILSVFIFGVFSHQQASAVDPAQSAQSAACAALGTADGSGTTDCSDSGGSSISNIISTVINIISIAGAVVAVVMIIIAGIKYTTSGGDSGSVSSAKNTIIYAVVGLIIIALAQIIVRFVVSRSTNSVDGSSSVSQPKCNIGERC